MAIDSSGGTSSDGDLPDDELTRFRSLLNELKATGCNLLLVGDARPELFTRASSSLLGDHQSVRYRLLGVTDASRQSISERLPDPSESPRSLAETAHIVNHAATPRSATTATSSRTSDGLDTIPETQVADPNLEGLESALVEGIEAFAAHDPDLRPSELRLGLDSVGTLLDHHGEESVRRCLRTVGSQVHDKNGMAHYVFKQPYDSERVQTLAGDVDAVIEIRSVNPKTHDHDAQQRWHVPNRDLTMDWIRL